MYYREALRVRHNVIIFLIIIACLVVLQVVSNVAQYGSPIRTEFAPELAKAHTPLTALFAIAGIVSAVFAGILGTSLSCENNGHLELAWTKPVSRSRYALTVMSVDWAAILAVYLLSLCAVGVLVAVAGFGGHHIVIDQHVGQNIARFSILPFAWYALIQMLTASLRERGGVVSGLSWVAAIVLLGLATADFGHFWSGVITFANYFNPIAYALGGMPLDQPPYPFPTWELNICGLLMLVVLGVAAALTQWRRLEA